MPSRSSSSARGPVRGPARLVAAVVAVVVGVGLLPLALSSAEGAPGVASFAPLPGFSLQDGRARVAPSAFKAYDVDLAAVATSLAKAPVEGVVGAVASRLTLPDPSGLPVTFAIQEVPIMAPELAAQHPEITTYAGTQVDEPSRTVAIDLSPTGFHASVRVLGGRSWYVDPAYNGRGVTQHLSYYVDDLPEGSEVLDEKELEETGDELTSEAKAGSGQRAGEAPGAAVTYRTFRVALVTDPAYATYFGTANVLAEKANLLNRVNQIYTQDVAVRMLLANGSDKLNLDTAAKATGANGPCGASACYTADNLSSCSSDLLTRNEFAMGQLVGADEFDIGHIALGGGGGGIAGLGVVGEEYKADGCTGLETPDGDAFAIDFVAHEMGHEFGGNHTFNGASGSCMGTNRNGDTSVEPGSGTSVMAYAGICFSDDTQAHTDPYFSQRSIDELTGHITADRTSYSEIQVLALTAFSTGETVTLGYPGNAVTQVITAGDTAASITTKLRTLTGATVAVSGYDGATSAGLTGATITWPDALDHPRIAIVATTGDARALIGVTTNGGPGTNHGVETVTSNHNPTVVAAADKTIPLRTPFVLSGSATDVDPGDQAKLSLLWEQNDPGLGTGLAGVGALLIAPDRTDGPLFRVFGTQAKYTTAAALEYMSNGENLADGSGTRSFPDRAQVLADNTNAESGTCIPPVGVLDPTARVPDAYLDCLSEFLPTAAYVVGSGELNFRLTARDNNTMYGGVQHDDTTLTVGTAGPFGVTSRATAGTPATGGASETVAWDVNQTDTATYATDVKISLSTDGGLTFPTVLAASTPNDGTEAVTLPDVQTSKARLLVEAVGNYFYDTNDADFTINGTSTPMPSGTTTSPTAPTSPTSPSGTATAGGSPTATGATTGPTPAAGIVRTRTRIRLPKPVQVVGRKPVKLLFQVVGTQVSAGPAGRAVLRIDGRVVRSVAAPVTLKAGRTVRGFTVRIPRSLRAGDHRVQVAFVATDAAAYTSSSSRRITLTVVGRARSRNATGGA